VAEDRRERVEMVIVEVNGLITRAVCHAPSLPDPRRGEIHGS
jgi:hypothetical protein